MMNRLVLNYLLVLSFGILGCSGGPQASQERASETSALPVENIPFDPTLLSEEWVNVIIADSLDHAIDVGFVLEVIHPDSPLEIVFSATSDDGLGFYQLLETEQDLFTLSMINGSAQANIKRHENSAEISIYDMVELDLDEDGINEVLVAAEIYGMTHGEDGSRPYQMIQYEVLSKTSKGYLVELEYGTQVNRELGVDIDGYPNLTGVDFLLMKYNSHVLELDQEDWKDLLDEIEVSCGGYDDTDHEFATIREKDGQLVIDHSWLNSGYYLVTDHASGFQIDHGAYSNFPMLYISDRDVEEHKISDLSIDTGYIELQFEGLTGDRERTSGRLTYDEGKWVFSYEGYQYMMNKDSKDLEHINTESGQ